MCTLTVAWQVFEDEPLVIAANRDESYARESSPPQRFDAQPPYIAPRDERAGGTWLGYNAAGVFVGLTNRWCHVEDGGRRSRGQLVRELLESTSAATVKKRLLTTLSETTYDGFNLLVADVGWAYDAVDTRCPRAFVCTYDGAPSTDPLPSGVHVLVNVGLDGASMTVAPDYPDGDEQAAQANTLRNDLITQPQESGDEWRSRAQDALGDHSYNVCIHRPETGFGTVSASVVKFSDDRTAEYWFADGPPCKTPFSRVSASVSETNER